MIVNDDLRAKDDIVAQLAVVPNRDARVQTTTSRQSRVRPIVACGPICVVADLSRRINDSRGMYALHAPTGLPCIRWKIATNAISGSLTRTSVLPFRGTDASTTAAAAFEAWNWDRNFSSRTTVMSSPPGESLSGLAARMIEVGSPTTSPSTHAATSHR